MPADDGDPPAGAFVCPQLAGERLGESGVVVSGAGEHDRGGLLGPEQFDVLQLAVRVTVAVADDQQPTVLDRDALQTTGDLGEVRVGHVVHDHPDRDPVCPRQELGVRVRHVVQFLDRLEDPRSQLLGHPAFAAADHPGHRRGRHTGSPRHIGERRHDPASLPAIAHHPGPHRVRTRAAPSPHQVRTEPGPGPHRARTEPGPSPDRARTRAAPSPDPAAPRLAATRWKALAHGIVACLVCRESAYRAGAAPARPASGRRARMGQRSIGIALNGVTGRMGYRQHLVRSLLAIREQGGLPLAGGERLWPEPVLVGRDETKLGDIARRHGLTDWSTDLAAILARPDIEIYFDAQVTAQREKAIRAAIDAGKHVYTEKPLAEETAAARDLAEAATAAGVKHGAVMDKLFLPGLRKLARLIDGGFFGRVLSVRGEFGYWVFEGDWQQAQRPSWNYRAADGGGIVMDMFPHWHYVLETLFGRIRAVPTRVATHVPKRWDEHGRAYDATADDAAYAIFELDGDVIATVNSSWAVRVFRDELVEFQVDGTHGSAVAGLRRCRVQHRASTPKPVWNPDLPATEDFRARWQEVPDNEEFDNAFK